MNHSRFLPPPVRLGQALEAGAGGDGITRRTFIKRTGGATVATLIAWNLTTNEAIAADEESGSWGMICVNPPFESSVVDTWTDAIIVPQSTEVPAEERFRIRVVIASNKIMDPPTTDAYDTCSIQYTATVSIIQPGFGPYLDHYIDKLVIADRNGGVEEWQTTYDSWNGGSKTIDVVAGDQPVAHVKVTIRTNSGSYYRLFISGEWTDFDFGSPPAEVDLPAVPFEEFSVPYPHRFIPKLK